MNCFTDHNCCKCREPTGIVVEIPDRVLLHPLAFPDEDVVQHIRAEMKPFCVSNVVFLLLWQAY